MPLAASTGVRSPVVRRAFNVVPTPAAFAIRKAVLTVVGAVYGGVDLSWGHLGSIRHGSIFYRARIDSRGWRCFFPVRDGTA